MNNRTVLFICPTGTDAAFRQTILANGWDLDTVSDLDEARERQRNGTYRVGLIAFDQSDDVVWSEIEQFFAMTEPTVWIALISPGARESRRLGKLIYDKFYDYLTLPIDRDRLLFALGHASGMAALYDKLIEEEHSQWERVKVALQKSEACFSNLLEGTIQGILIHLDWKPLFINHTYADLLGYDSPDEILAMETIDPLFPAHERTRLRGYQRARLRGEAAPERYEFQALRKDGTSITLENRVSIIDWQGQKATQSIVVDVTERKHSQQALRESERRFRAIFDQTFQFTGLLAPDGAVLEANQTALDFGGLRWEQVIGRPFWQTRWWSLSAQTRTRLKTAITEAAQGEFVRYEVDVLGANDKVATIDFSLKPMLDEAGRVVLLIAEGRDISEWNQAKEALAGSREELRRLASHLQSVREEEQTRIAREIHDDMGQSLTGLKYQLKRLQTGLPVDDAAAHGEIAEMVKTVDAMMLAVQRICADLRPAILDDLGLSAACEWELEQFRKRTGIDIQFFCDWNQEITPDKDRKTALFRIFQEALTNVARHARATEVSVRLAKENGGLVLEIFDNGVGITAAAADDSTALGIIGMRERARVLDGKLTVTALPDGGTGVRCEIPCKTGIP